MSSFRASPWVTYEPTTSYPNRQQPHPASEMDGDVDMEAPQISTLREEVTPPPASMKSKSKLGSIPWLKPPGWSKGPNGSPLGGKSPPFAREDQEEPEEEEDQLIDDDDDALQPSGTSSSRPSGNIQNRKLIAKRKSRKGNKPAGDMEGKSKEKIPDPLAVGAQNLAPTMSCFKATPTESHEDTETASISQIKAPDDTILVKAKKVSPRKPPTIHRAKTKLVKQKTAIPPLLLDDMGALSESYAGTAASSPVTLQFDQNSPEPENTAPNSPHTALAPLPEELNLENVPIPVYPLPTKPFPVQPPPKITSGFAPLVPLDKSSKAVRHWRPARREIRGIAGGRWLARTWVGDKESEYASFVADSTVQGKSVTDDKTSSGVALPKLPALSISSAPASIKTLGRLKASSKAGSIATSANPSRAPSANPEPQGIPIATPAVRAPTKMRILQLAPPSGDGDPPIDN
ncbi:hypothetical protein BYT27DRAFT_7256441 [Phlegmacium glaucopus]|nr:hypothetical protein BYT27DRAFT_7256441 [Phlegmacium glaucopus]